MSSNHQNSATNIIEMKFVTLISMVLLLLGIILTGTSIYCYVHGNDFAASVLINLGTGFITASITALLLERFSRHATHMAHQHIADAAVHHIDANMFGPKGIKTVLQNEIQRGFESTEIIVNEILRSAYTDEIKRTVFGSGITSAFSSWSGLIPDEFFTSQASIDIFLKDGTTLFKRRSELIKNRFKTSDQSTRIMIVHPDYEFMNAVASLDPYKSGNHKVQKDEIIDVIRTMHTIRQQLLNDGINIMDRVEFIGYRAIPAWTGYIGNSFAYIHLYFSRPWRGDLNTLFISALDSNRNPTAWYQSYRLDVEELARSNEINDDRNLWNYVLPSN